MSVNKMEMVSCLFERRILIERKEMSLLQNVHKGKNNTITTEMHNEKKCQSLDDEIEKNNTLERKKCPKDILNYGFWRNEPKYKRNVYTRNRNEEAAKIKQACKIHRM